MLKVQSSLTIIPGTIAAIFLGFNAASPPGYTATSQDVDLQVGVVQRFGRQPTDVLTLQVQPGDRLTIQVPAKGKPQTLSSATANWRSLQRLCLRPD